MQSNWELELRSSCSKALVKTRAISAHFWLSSAPLERELERMVTRRPGRVMRRSTAQAARVKDLPVWRPQSQHSMPSVRLSKAACWYGRRKRSRVVEGAAADLLARTAMRILSFAA